MAKKKLSFEAAMERLNEIVQQLEGGEIPLQESLSLFEEGSGLLKTCNDMLETAEQKVALLKHGDNGEAEEVPFE